MKIKSFFKKFILIFLALLLLLLVFIFTVDAYVSRTGKKHVLNFDEVDEKYDCILVPGASVVSNYPSAILRDRLDEAYRLYEKGVSDRILVSGDHGQIEYDEVNVMRNYLLDKGARPEDVFMDHAGFDTYQTVYRAAEIFEVKKTLIVTQGFHLYRALYLAEKIGLEAHGVDSALRVYSKENFNRLREYPARVKAFLEAEILRPEPKYLGDKIPIDGENLTID